VPLSTAPTDASGGAGFSEVVTRPEPGLARGRWEAPAWLFVVVAALAIAGGMAWLLYGLSRRRRG